MKLDLRKEGLERARRELVSAETALNAAREAIDHCADNPWAWDAAIEMINKTIAWRERAQTLVTFWEGMQKK